MKCTGSSLFNFVLQLKEFVQLDVALWLRGLGFSFVRGLALELTVYIVMLTMPTNLTIGGRYRGR